MTAADTTGVNNETPQISTGKGRTALDSAVLRNLQRVVVDIHAHRPDMFEITFTDSAGSVLADAGIGIGTIVSVASVSAADSATTELISGEVTALEGFFDRNGSHTVVRGYTKDHRLQRARRTRTFVNAKDSDVARRIASEHKIPVGDIDPTRTTYNHVGQVNQTDWEFLRARADALGFDFGVRDDKFFFTKAVQADKAADVVPLTFPETLRGFRPRITAGNLAPQAEFRMWDPTTAKTVTSVAGTTAVSADGELADPAEVANTFKSAARQSRKRATGVSRDNPQPITNGFVVSTVPAGVGNTASSAATEHAAGAAERLGSTVAEAEGEAVGDPGLRAGTAIDVTGVGDTFSGRWVVTRAVHTYDNYGYSTRFEVSGRQERSILGLNTAASTSSAPSIPGVACGIVSNINDPDKLGRVRIALPWLAPDFESDWAPVTQPGAGTTTGMRLMPQVGDQVLVGFEFGDPRRPYVLGGVYTDQSVNGLGGEVLKKTGAAASVVWRGISTPTGSRLAFHDEVTAGAKPKTIACDFVLGTKDADLALVVDKVKGTVTLRCIPKPDGKPAPPGKLTIECGDRGTIDIKAGKGGTVNIDGGAQLNVTAKAQIKIESKGMVQIKGNPIKLN